MDIKDIENASTEEKLAFLRRIAEVPSWEANYDSIYRELLADPCPEVRRMCLTAFWDLGDDGDLDRITEIAENDPDPAVRAEACSTLGIYVYEGAMLEEMAAERYAHLRAFLIERFSDESEDTNVRRFALESLGFDGEGEIEDMLRWAYDQADPRWKASAVFSMGRAGVVIWSDSIVEALDSEERPVRLAAVRAASEGYCEAATPKLRNLALAKDKEIQLEAVWALGRAGGPGALETLEVCAGIADPEEREMARDAIEEYRLLADLDEQTLDWEEDLTDEEEFDTFGVDWEPGQYLEDPLQDIEDEDDEDDEDEDKPPSC